MDLSKFFDDDRVKRFKTHIVMKSVGIESKQFKGWQHPPKKDSDGNPAYELFAAKNQSEMEALGWVLVKPVAEPTDAKPAKATKAKENVEG